MPSLLVLIGPTGVGKTELSLRLAERYHTCIVSADSRQLYADLKIGTAAPTPEQLARVEHHLVGTLQLADYYSAARYEEEVMNLLPRLFVKHPVVLLTGGSMMYVDAVCKGIDDIPTVDDETRRFLLQRYEEEGLERLCAELRPFRMVKVGLTRDREELYRRINLRVDQMMADGLLEEALRVYPYRSLNSLNTVGYKELFKYFDGEWTLDFAVEKIKQNSRIYSRKQMTWFKRDADIRWFHPEQEAEITAYLDNVLPLI